MGALVDFVLPFAVHVACPTVVERPPILALQLQFWEDLTNFVSKRIKLGAMKFIDKREILGVRTKIVFISLTAIIKPVT